MTPTPPPKPSPGTNQTPDSGMTEAAASLAPHKTLHGHRPDWQTARDDESQRID